MNKQIIIIIFISFLTACARIGPDIIQASGNDYNVAIQQTNNEQLLLNLVRLKYRETPYFLEVNSVSSQFALTSEAAISANFKKQQTPEAVGLSGKLNYSEQPTVTYLPLHGNDFIQRLLSPISIDTILLLANSGWSIERILRLTVQSINGIPNAPTASGPTPNEVPVYKDFIDLTEELRKLQKNGTLKLAYSQEEGKETPVILLDEKNLLPVKLQMLLDIEPGNTYTLTAGTGKNTNKHSIVISTRSLLGVMYYLSHSVNVPEQDKKAGKVTITKDQYGNEFDWNELTQGLFKIQSANQINTSSAIGTKYRGNWFYIDDNDLDSKTTFSLLTQLFSLQAGKAEGITPVLTLPIGK